MRLIDADMLHGDYIVASITTNTPCKLYVSMEQINNAPIVDAVKHGEWEIHDVYKQTIDGQTFDGWCECSECRTMYTMKFSIFNYCPNCGVKMDKKEINDDK